jgi:hypothetical protein
MEGGASAEASPIPYPVHPDGSLWDAGLQTVLGSSNGYSRLRLRNHYKFKRRMGMTFPKIETADDHKTMYKCTRCGLTTREGQFLKAHLLLLKKPCPPRLSDEPVKKVLQQLSEQDPAVVIRRFDSTMLGRPVLGNGVATTNSAPGSNSPKFIIRATGNYLQRDKVQVHNIFVDEESESLSSGCLRMSGNTMYFQCDETVEDVEFGSVLNRNGAEQYPLVIRTLHRLYLGETYPCASGTVHRWRVRAKKEFDVPIVSSAMDLYEPYSVVNIDSKGTICLWDSASEKQVVDLVGAVSRPQSSFLSRQFGNDFIPSITYSHTPKCCWYSDHGGDGISLLDMRSSIPAQKDIFAINRSASLNPAFYNRTKPLTAERITKLARSTFDRPHDVVVGTQHSVFVFDERKGGEQFLHHWQHGMGGSVNGLSVTPFDYREAGNHDGILVTAISFDSGEVVLCPQSLRHNETILPHRIPIKKQVETTMAQMQNGHYWETELGGGASRMTWGAGTLGEFSIRGKNVFIFGFTDNVGNSMMDELYILRDIGKSMYQQRKRAMGQMMLDMALDGKVGHMETQRCEKEEQGLRGKARPYVPEWMKLTRVAAGEIEHKYREIRVDNQSGEDGGYTILDLMMKEFDVSDVKRRWKKGLPTVPTGTLVSSGDAAGGSNRPRAAPALGNLQLAQMVVNEFCHGIKSKMREAGRGLGGRVLREKIHAKFQKHALSRTDYTFLRPERAHHTYGIHRKFPGALRKSRVNPTDISSRNAEDYVGGALYRALSDVLLDRRKDEIFGNPNDIWSLSVSPRTRKHKGWRSVREKAKYLWGETDEMYTKEISALAEEAEERLDSDSMGMTYVDKVYRKKKRTPPRVARGQSRQRVKRQVKDEKRSWDL